MPLAERAAAGHLPSATGTLDSLLALSNDLVKSNIFIEGISHKIRRQIKDLERAGGVEPGTLTVDGVPVDSYLTRFVWDEGKYPVNAPLKETVASIQSEVAKIEDDMKFLLSASGAAASPAFPPAHQSNFLLRRRSLKEPRGGHPCFTT